MAGIQDVLSAFQIGAQNDARLTGEAGNILQQQKAIGQQAIPLRAEADAAAMAANKQKLEGELAAQTAARNIADSLGANPDTQNFKLAMLGQTFWDNFNEANKQADIVAQKRSTGFLDNPLAWIGNQLTIDSDIAKHDAAAMKANTAINAMQQINATVTSAATAQKSISETVTRDSIAQAMRSAEITSKLTQMEMEQRNLSYDLEGIKLLQAGNERMLDRAAKVNQIQVQQQQLAISQGHLALAQAEAADRAKMRSLELEKLNDEKAGWQEATRAYNVGAGTLGLPPVSEGELKQRIKFGGEAAKKDFEQNYQIGISRAATGQGIIAPTPGAAAITIAQKRAPLNPGMQDTKDFLMSTMQAAVTQAQSLDPTKPLKQEAVAQATTELAATRGIAMAKDVSKDPFGKNLYKAPDYKTMLDVPSVGKSVFGQQIVAPQVAGGGSATNPEVLIDAGLVAVASGKLSYKEFVDGFVNYFNEAKNWNNATKNFKAVAMPLQSTYKTSVYNGTSLPFGRTNIVDLSDRSQVENFLLRRRAASINQNGGLESFFPVQQ